MPFPETAATLHFRSWILQRRPKAPSFFGCPLPKHRPQEQQQTACIIMSYFHPWTLRSLDAEEHVPSAESLRGAHMTCQQSFALWLDGHVLCQAAKRHMGSFMSVHRCRPQDDEDSDVCNSEDIISDEELHLSDNLLEEALTTRIGGREEKKGNEGTA